MHGVTGRNEAGSTLSELEALTPLPFRPEPGLRKHGLDSPMTTPIKKPSKMSGFTLLELMVGLAIAAIMVALAVPSFAGLLHDQRVATEVRKLYVTLGFARNEALKRRRTTAVCASSNGTSCSGSASWENGYIVFVNEDNDSPPVVDAGETVVKIIQAAPDNLTLRGDAFSTFISFAQTTFANSAGTFTVCDHRGAAEARGILVNAVGRARSSEDIDADELHEDRNGNDLSC